MTTLTTDIITTTTATRSPLFDALLSHPTPLHILGGSRVGRGDLSGLVPGGAGMVMTILGLGLELVENSK